MAEANTRLTIDHLPEGCFAPPNDLARIADRGLRRHRAWSLDFDARAMTLSTEIGDDWEEGVKAQWRASHARVIEGLRHQFGERDLNRKVRDFTDIGTKPFSILAYHNSLFEQVRSAFTGGAYYPALTGSCALGERILNHLVLDLRDDFRGTPEYRRVHSKSSFNNWHLATSTLLAWDVLLPDVAEEFSKLETLRHRSIHFNPHTYADLRDDALAAVAHIRLIIDRQFGWFGTQPWFIEGVLGASFIKREYETKPFIRRFFLPQCPFVGVRCAIEFDQNHRPRHIDFHDYGDGELTDEEFRDAFNSRDPASIANSSGTA
jgi:hypothetical protein